MSTNYYWYASGKERCECCEQRMPNLHVGKSSAGWCFSLRVHSYTDDDSPILSLEDWKERWKTGAIFDEHGTRVEPAEMLAVITERSWDGNKWTAEALSRNYARRGPNGLARHTHGDVKPGDGTYDLCNYEFS